MSHDISDDNVKVMEVTPELARLWLGEYSDDVQRPVRALPTLIPLDNTGGTYENKN